MTPPNTPSGEPLFEPPLFSIRGHRVILDADLAKLYGVATKRLNEAFKRNTERFPSDFAFQLVPEEAENLKSRIVTSSSGIRSQFATAAEESPSMRSQIVTSSPNWSQFATSSDRHRGAVYLPWGFAKD